MSPLRTAFSPDIFQIFSFVMKFPFILSSSYLFYNYFYEILGYFELYEDLKNVLRPIVIASNYEPQIENFKFRLHTFMVLTLIIIAAYYYLEFIQFISFVFFSTKLNQIHMVLMILASTLALQFLTPEIGSRFILFVASKLFDTVLNSTCFLNNFGNIKSKQHIL